MGAIAWSPVRSSGRQRGAERLPQIGGTSAGHGTTPGQQLVYTVLMMPTTSRTPTKRFTGKPDCAMTKTDNAAKKVILVVEDLPFDAEFTLQALEKFEGSVDVDVARDGWDALVLMKQRHFDLILMDLKMPRMDGFETMILMRGYQLQYDVPLIILSNSDLDADRERARQLGAVDYVHKSGDLARFRSSLQATVEKHMRI